MSKEERSRKGDQLMGRGLSAMRARMNRRERTFLPIGSKKGKK